MYELQALQDQILAELRDDPEWTQDIEALVSDLENENLDPEGAYGSAWDILQLGVVTATIAAEENNWKTPSD